MTSSSRTRWARRLCRVYDLMLLAYPPDFRRDFAREMTADVRRRLQEAAEGGRSTLAVLTLEIVSDWLRTATRERLDERTSRSAIDAGGGAVISLFGEHNTGRAADSERSARAWSLVLVGVGAFLLVEGWVRWFRAIAIWR